MDTQIEMECIDLVWSHHNLKNLGTMARRRCLRKVENVVHWVNNKNTNGWALTEKEHRQKRKEQGRGRREEEREGGWKRGREGGREGV